LGFYRKLHGELVENFLGVSVNDQGDGRLHIQTSLLAIENLVFSNLAGRGLVLGPCGGVFDFDVGEGMRPASVSHEQGIALAEVASIFGARTHSHQSAVGIMALAGRNSLADYGRLGIATKVDHFGARVGLLVVVG
jgi:hypothetical protein